MGTKHLQFSKVSPLKIFKSSCKSLLSSNPTLSEYFPKISKVTLLKLTQILKFSENAQKIDDNNDLQEDLKIFKIDTFEQHKFCTCK